jgi:predicted DNA-binding transcriptional regulator AlpA
MELEKLLTPEQLAELLGVKLSWVYRHSAPGCDPPEQRLPSVKVGRKVRFERSAIQAWLAGNSGASGGPDAPENADSRAVGRSRSDSFEKGRVGTHAGNGHVKSSVPVTEG